MTQTASRGRQSGRKTRSRNIPRVKSSDTGPFVLKPSAGLSDARFETPEQELNPFKASGGVSKQFVAQVFGGEERL